MPISPARTAAFDILHRVERENSYASELLHSTANEKLSTADHALATELVMGVLRWRSRLDDEISKASSQPLTKLDLEILIALRLALYQFRWLDRVPQRAALHESVELVKRARKRSAAPFVNAVLRKLSKSPASEISADEISPAALALRFAHPAWMVERWVQQFGPAATDHICNHNQSVPVTAIRLRTPTAEKELRDEGISLAPGALLTSARRVESGEITKTKAFRTGAIVIQDEASQLIAALLAPQSKEHARILDCCAAPGGKTLALADRNPSSMITAVEVHPHRARLMQKRLHQAAPAAKIEVLTADVLHLQTAHTFDLVLADVPCSGTGTLARNPEIKWRLTLEDLEDLQARQSAILRSALAHIAPGGRLLYSTCSLEKEENEDVVEQTLVDQAEGISFRLLDCSEELDRLKTAGDLSWPDLVSLTRGRYLRTFPGVHPCDGFFAAILEKI